MNPDLPHQAEINQPTQRKPNWGLLLGATPFTCFALYASYGFYLSYHSQEDAHSFYRPVSAKVLSSRIDSQMERRGNSSSFVYKALVTYEYQVQGKTYQSHRFSYTGGVHGNRDDAHAVIAHYPVGSVHTAYFNPDKPEEAVLNRSSPPVWWKYFWFPALFLTVGVLAMYAGWRGWLRKS